VPPSQQQQWSAWCCSRELTGFRTTYTELVELGESADPAPATPVAKPAAKPAAKQAAKPAEKPASKGSAPAPAKDDRALKDAKAACQAAWTETKRQSTLINNAAEKGMEDVKDAVTKAGGDIQKAIVESVKAAGKAAAAATPPTAPAAKAPAKPAAKKAARRVGVRSYSLGDSNAEGSGSGAGAKPAAAKPPPAPPAPAAGDLDKTTKVKVLAHAACQAFWNGVETACLQFDRAASSGKATLDAAVKSSSGKFVEDAKSALSVVAAPPASKAAAPAAAPAGSAAGSAQF